MTRRTRCVTVSAAPLFEQVLDNVTPLCFNGGMDKNKAEASIEVVLDHLVAVGGVVTGQVRKDHRLGWVSALHVLTEQLLDGDFEESFQVGTPHHTEYRYVAAAIVYLESLGFIEVEREHGSSSKGNYVNRIRLVY